MMSNVGGGNRYPITKINGVAKKNFTKGEEVIVNNIPSLIDTKYQTNNGLLSAGSVRFLIVSEDGLFCTYKMSNNSYYLWYRLYKGDTWKQGNYTLSDSHKFMLVKSYARFYTFNTLNGISGGMFEYYRDSSSSGVWEMTGEQFYFNPLPQQGEVFEDLELYLSNFSWGLRILSRNKVGDLFTEVYSNGKLYNPRLSPDGLYMIALDKTDYTASIFKRSNKSSMDWQPVTKLTAVSSWASNFGARWSRDGLKVAFFIGSDDDKKYVFGRSAVTSDDFISIGILGGNVIKTCNQDGLQFLDNGKIVTYGDYENTDLYVFEDDKYYFKQRNNSLSGYRGFAKNYNELFSVRSNLIPSSNILTYVPRTTELHEFVHTNSTVNTYGYGYVLGDVQSGKNCDADIVIEY